ncbi:MAG: glycoside hydrolase family 127 protein [Clostridia bacterium]|nr:glycoside hydrolase family 127 protein [Clostridia bacterium]
MSYAIENLYPADSRGAVMRKRTDTDQLFTDMSAVCEFKGNLDKAIRFIEDFQLLDAEHWARFVEQFIVHSDDGNGGWRGEYWGKMMRGAAFTYSYTKNPTLYKVLTQTVEDMMKAADEQGRISSKTVATEFNGWDIWCRKYVLLGMQYYLEICEDADLRDRIIASMRGQVDYLIAKLGPANEGKKPITRASQCWRGLNSSSVLEPVVRLYDLTGEKSYLDFASYIVSEGGISLANIFELAYADTTDPYQYPVTKAYEMISNFEGLLEYYRVTGIEKWKTAVLNFGRRLMKTDITIIGSAGCYHEQFDHAAVRQTDPNCIALMQETCVTVTWMKFCWQLLAVSGDPAFADCFEQALYNAYLGSINTERCLNTDTIKGRFPDAVLEPLPFDSYATLLPGTRGRAIGGLCLMPDQHYYGCCACIGPAGTGLISKVATMLSNEGIAVNLYIPGSVITRTPSGQSVRLDTVTAYPVEGKVEMTIGLDKAEEFTLSLRIPAWSEQTTLTVNGEAVDAAAGYTKITRLWNSGDVVVLELDMRTRVLKPEEPKQELLMVAKSWGDDVIYPTMYIPSPYCKYHVALRRGPLVLARDARLDGTVDEAVDVKCDENGVVELEPSAKAGFDTIVEYRVPQNNGKYFTVVDFSSAGKVWGERYACWLPTREYWR